MMKKTLYFISIIINLFGMVLAVQDLDFIFATAFVAAIFAIVTMMVDDDDDQDKPDPPKTSQSQDKPEPPDENKSSGKTDTLEINESPEGGS